MSKALKHYIIYSGSSGWWHSENLSVQEWVNKIDHNVNSLCQLGRGAHIQYSANLVVCARVGGSGAIPPMLSNSMSPQILIDTVKGVTINIVTSPVYDRANVNARFKSEIWVMHCKLRVVAGNLTVQNTGCLITWTNVDLSSVRSSVVILKAIMLEILMKVMTTMSLKITCIRSKPCPQGDNELSQWEKRVH